MILLFRFFAWSLNSFSKFSAIRVSLIIYCKRSIVNELTIIFNKNFGVLSEILYKFNEKRCAAAAKPPKGDPNAYSRTEGERSAGRVAAGARRRLGAVKVGEIETSIGFPPLSCPFFRVIRRTALGRSCGIAVISQTEPMAESAAMRTAARQRSECRGSGGTAWLAGSIVRTARIGRGYSCKLKSPRQ